MSFDLDAILRWLKPQRRKICPPRRAEEDLPWVKDAPLIGGPLLLDTNVYIDLLQGATPVEVDKLLQLRSCNHSAVCVSELTHAFGRLDPAHQDTPVALRQIHKVIAEDIPPHRVHAPEAASWAAAGVLAGLICRLRGYPRKQGHERRLVNDALLYLQGRKLGSTVLTRNVEDFDLLGQLAPGAQLLFYRKAA